MEHESPSSRKSSQGERKQVTVLFADVAGFTQLSEKLDPEEVRDLMRPAIDIMAEDIPTAKPGGRSGLAPISAFQRLFVAKTNPRDL
ncbi:MAG: hypothetical protein JW854_07745 [Actinobacteria bacterium]|nr:hypothetical protein [Actinomycetota bacterium]